MLILNYVVIRTLSMKELTFSYIAMSRWWPYSIIKTIATEDKGLNELVEKLIEHNSFINKQQNILSSKQDQRYISKVKKILYDKINNEFWNDNRKENLNIEISKTSNQRISPFDFVEKLLKNE